MATKVKYYPAAMHCGAEKSEGVTSMGEVTCQSETIWRGWQVKGGDTHERTGQKGVTYMRGSVGADSNGDGKGEQRPKIS